MPIPAFSLKNSKGSSLKQSRSSER